MSIRHLYDTEKHLEYCFFAKKSSCNIVFFQKKAIGELKISIFDKYLKYGYYPFFVCNREGFNLRLNLRDYFTFTWASTAPPPIVHCSL